jgi:hypothetical protein
LGITIDHLKGEDKVNRSPKIVTIALVAAMLIAPTLSQAHASELASLYDLTGTWIWHYTYGESSEEYHTMAINYFDTGTGDFSGFGFRNDNSAYNWTVMGREFLDIESGIAFIEFTIEYDQNSPIPGYYIYATGSLSSPTYMSRTATLTQPPEEGPSALVVSVESEGMPASWEATKFIQTSARVRRFLHQGLKHTRPDQQPNRLF